MEAKLQLNKMEWWIAIDCALLAVLVRMLIWVYEK